MKLKFYISLVITLLTVSVFAQEATLTAKVSKNNLNLNQLFKIEFSTNSLNGKDFSPPNFKDFKIIGKPTNSASSTWIKGKTTYNSKHTYVLKPQKKGKFKIGSASIKINDKILKTKPIKIIVKELKAEKIYEQDKLIEELLENLYKKQ